MTDTTATLGASASVAAWAEGRLVSRLDATELAYRLLAAAAEALIRDASNGSRDHAGLTPRELEILKLLAQGYPDRQIATMLSISPRTVGDHVTNVLGKLDVESRTAAAAFAIRHDLD